jgi:antitoxin StbD
MSLKVVPTSEARIALPSTLARFREEGPFAEPMVFGGHRKAEGVVLPYELFERIMPAIEAEMLAATVRARLSQHDQPVDFDDFAARNGFDTAAYLATKQR